MDYDTRYLYMYVFRSIVNPCISVLRRSVINHTPIEISDLGAASLPIMARARLDRLIYSPMPLGIPRGMAFFFSQSCGARRMIDIHHTLILTS